MPDSAAPTRSRPLRIALVLLALLTVAGAAWQLWAARTPVTGGAEWIWAALPEDLPTPAAFYLVRDFDLSADPRGVHLSESDLRGARLFVQGDEEYALHLNGRRLGSNRYAPGAPLDVYEVGDLLLPNTNRLAVEVRSARGAGGFLAALQGADGEALLVSDDSWRVVRRYLPGLVEGWLVLPPLAVSGAAGEPASEAAVSWGRPPVGRWGRPGLGQPRPLLATVGECCPSWPSVLSPLVVPETASAAAPGASSSEAGPPNAEPPADGDLDAAATDSAASVADRPHPVRAVFDFGRPVTGYLLIEHPPTSPAAPPQVNLFAVGDEPPRLVPPDDLGAGAAALPLITVPGRAVWSDVVPRTFRYAAVAGLAPPLRASLLEVAPEAVADLPGATRGEAAASGLLGLRPPARRTPAQDTVRRRLEAAPDAAAADTAAADEP